MSYFRSAFRQINSVESYQVASFGPRNNAFSVFLPSNINGLTFWIDLSDSAYVTSSGGVIDNVTNKGSASGSAKSDVVGARPVYLQNYVNNKHVASFDGINDILTSSVGVPTIFNVAATDPITTYTACAIMKLNRLNTVGTYPYQTDVVAAWGNASWGINMGSSDGNNNRIWHDFGNNNLSKWVRSTDGQVSSGSTVSVFTKYLTGAIDVYVNGTFVSGVISVADPTSAAGSLRIGNEIFPSNGNPALFELCEFLIYTGALSNPELANLNTYFNSKWGI